jgi:ribonucleotide reductase alpha subunit
VQRTSQTPLATDMKPGEALSVSRYFTKPGVEPFDTVEWELRDARIGHGDRVAFEQRGVEFPATWSQNATNIVAQKYFRGQLGSPAREHSVKQMVGRVAGTIADWGRARGYFASVEDSDTFQAELAYVLLHQMAAFNSPVWFNVGFEESPQCSACFILSVEDTMESILDWNTREGKIFLGGSGSGINLSNIRGSMEPLAKGGTASGPVSFMRGADSWAGTIKSGGKTRRAAKMVVLDVDHPDIREFIWCKAKEEKKANALRDAGFDMSIDGEGFISIQYQNANNSVRLTDAFMRAVENDEDWNLIARITGEPVGVPIPARELMREIAEAAWQCADPGVQYDTTINQWHTSPLSGRINASNPCCFVGETLVNTTNGPIAIAEIVRRATAGARLPHVASLGAGGEPMHVPITRAFSSGLTTQLCAVETEHGERFTCTPEHRFLTTAGDWIQARDLARRRIRSIADHVVEGSGTTPELVLTVSETLIVDVQIEQVPPTEVYDLEIAGLHNFSIGAGDGGSSLVVHNSEYMHVDDSACNLASLNLMKFRRADGSFDVDSFEHAVDVMFLAQEIIVGPSSYPTEKIGVNARAFRQLGLGYANLGAYLMSNGMAYDSDKGRATAAAITSLMTGRAYLGSARIAAAIGSYEHYELNRDAHNAVMRMHRDASYAIPDSATTDTALLEAARGVWEDTVVAGEEHGYRNAQATVLAPTGTISFLMDCDTTGVEPDFSLVKFKELVGGGQMTIVNQTIPMALRTLGYGEQQIAQIEAHINEHATIVGAPGLLDEHLSVFDVAVGERAISHMGHIKMMGAVQPFISGAISKTVNLPHEATVEDIADAYIQAWNLGVKALAIYRDGSKTAQALRTDAQEGASSGDAVVETIVVEGYSQEQVDELIEGAVAAARKKALAEAGPKRNRMPRERQSITHKFSIAGHEGYITAGMYEDGTVGEIFLTDIGKEGSTLRGMMNAFATSISIALQYGVPLDTLVEKFSYMRFEPEGITQNPEIPFAKSMPDYIMRWLASRFLDTDIQEELGILTPEVRARKMAEDAGTSAVSSDTNRPANGGTSRARARTNAPLGTVAGSEPATTRAAADALTDTPPVVPARMRGLDLGPACAQCGGMMQRTGSCYTCSSCGNNTGCG